MSRGRTLELGLTNRLYGPEIADIIGRFDEAPFQVQVWRDLAIARYKLYDATGMWLQSRRSLSTAAYRSVERAARAYLDESLAPAYFARLRTNPRAPAPNLKVEVANYVTRNFASLPNDEQAKAVAEFCRLSLQKEDWFYSLMGNKVFAAQNETGGYTLMLAEDY